MTEVRDLFEQIFVTNYMNLKSVLPSQEEAAERAIEFAKLVIQGQNIGRSLIEQWSLEMYMKYHVSFEIIKTPVLRLEESNWYSPKLLLGSFFWTRYRDYLIRIKHWDQAAVHSIDDSTNEIMSSLGNPNDSCPFDKRGLVLGYVQSGKTANFTGLINKAYDVGYKLIIVLSGIHNDLRAQTQLRLEEEVIGSRLDKEGNPIGVAQVYANTPNHIITSWTTVERDISSEPSGIFNLNQRTLMVVKKNSIVLESLKNQLEYQRNLFNLDIPVLIIDDEADQASVDTSKDEDPKTINKLIRQILEVFNRRCYVGYTATPFANLLINTEAKTEDEGRDLYPKDFLVGLPKPKEYCGPEEFFNVEEDADDPRPSLIRPLGIRVGIAWGWPPFWAGSLDNHESQYINPSSIRVHVPLMKLLYVTLMRIVKLGMIPLGVILEMKKVVVKIGELTKKHNISLRELSRLSDVRHAALSELSNGKRESISFGHIERIAEALNISDIREIIELVEEEGEPLSSRVY